MKNTNVTLLLIALLTNSPIFAGEVTSCEYIDSVIDAKDQRELAGVFRGVLDAYHSSDINYFNSLKRDEHSNQVDLSKSEEQFISGACIKPPSADAGWEQVSKFMDKQRTSKKNSVFCVLNTHEFSTRYKIERVSCENSTKKSYIRMYIYDSQLVRNDLKLPLSEENKSLWMVNYISILLSKNTHGWYSPDLFQTAP